MPIKTQNWLKYHFLATPNCTCSMCIVKLKRVDFKAKSKNRE